MRILDRLRRSLRQHGLARVDRDGLIRTLCDAIPAP